MTGQTKPLCDMSIMELEAELKRWDAYIRRAPAWTAHHATATQCRSDCKSWLDRRRAEARKVANG